MNQDEMLLRQVAASGTYTTTQNNEPHILIGKDRVINVPMSLRRLGVMNDHNIETVTFDCPRYWDGVDMSNMRVYIDYTRSDKVIGSYKLW